MQKQAPPGSRDVARAAIEMSMSRSREQELLSKKTLALESILTAAADFGGEFVPSIIKIVERAVVAARREGLIGESHLEELAKTYSIPNAARLPIDPKLSAGIDRGLVELFTGDWLDGLISAIIDLPPRAQA